MPLKFLQNLLLSILLLLSTSCSNSPEASESPVDSLEVSEPPAEIPVYTYEVVRTYPHDPQAFTQGLLFADGFLYEGTGLRGSSSLRKVDLESGQVLQLRQLERKYFGEGIALFGDRLIQLTWNSRVGFVYDRKSFEQLDRFTYLTEGWGLTHDGETLIMSDGTSTLYLLDPRTFEEKGQLQVRRGEKPVVRLNELEYIDGEIYANIWPTDIIARISPRSGQVLAWIDLAGLLSADDRRQSVDVLNGIAYDPKEKRFFVTGKWWPKLFEIKLVLR